MVFVSSWQRRSGYLLAALLVAALGLGCSSGSGDSSGGIDLLPSITGSRSWRATAVNGAGFTDATITVSIFDLQASSRASVVSQVAGRITSDDGQFANTEIAIGGLNTNRVLGTATTIGGVTYRLTIDVLTNGQQCRLTAETNNLGSVTVIGDETETPGGGGGTGSGGGDPDAQPRLTLSTTAVSLPAGTNSGTVDIGNDGTGTLAWTAVADVPFLSLDAASGSGDARLTITADRTGLASGTHTGNVTINSNGGRLVVVVTVVVP